MSSILKALKKLDEEKTRRSNGEINLSREILHEAPRRGKRFPWPWAVAGGTIALLLVLVVILLGRGPANQPPPTRPAQPAASVPQGTTLQAEPAQPPEAVGIPRQEIVRQKPAAPATGSPVARISVPLPGAATPDNRPALPQTAPPVTVPARPEPPKKAPQAAPTEAAFAVSGIAWNKDSADRLAIVNGQPLTTGSVIAGALVEEILPDRVRFSQGEKTFEIHLGKAGKTH